MSKQWSDILAATILEEAHQFYVKSGSGVFAYALWKSHGSPSFGKITILSDPNGMKCNNMFPEEITHAVYRTPNKEFIDVYGKQTKESISSRFDLSPSDFIDTMDPELFWHKICGEHESYPMIGSKILLTEALLFINTYPKKYQIQFH